MGRLRQHLIDTYLSFDPRSLGVFRVLCGLVLLGDLWFRYLGVDLWYTDEGLIPGSRLLQDIGPQKFSPFLHATTHGQAVLGMALCAVAYGLFTIGFRTRLFHFLSLVALVSLNKRVYMLESGGQYVITLLCVWSLFLPLGRRFSVDALLASLRSRKERRVEELAQREALRPDDRPVVSLAVLALLLQFAVIYLFNVLHKTGPAWMDGSAVHLALYHERVVTTLGVSARESLPYAALQFMSWATLVVEAAAVLLILSPLWSRHMRLVAIVLLPGLHLGFALGMNLGIFSWAMSVFFVLLLAPEHWQWLARRRSGKARHLIAYFDASCGLCFLFARVFARLDPMQQVSFVSNAEGELPEGVTRAVADRALVVEDPQAGRSTLGARAVAELIRTMPGGRFLMLPLVLPGAAWIADRVYDWVARNRTALSRRLGLAACGLETSPTAEPLKRRRVVAGRLRPAGRWLGEAAVVVLLVAAVGDLARNSPAWPDELRFRIPKPLNAIIAYPRMRQYWSMFAPEPARRIGILVVDAVTVDGRVVDPLNEVAGRHARIPANIDGGIPDRMGNNLFFAIYSTSLPRDDFRGYREPLRAWIYRYHERTGDPRDRIVRFRVYRVTCRLPDAPGEVKRDVRRTLVFDDR